MNVGVKASLRKEIDRFRQAIAQKNSELTSLNDELRRHERALELVGGGTSNNGRKTPPKSGKRATVDWNSVLSRLPNSFTLKEFTARPESRGKSPVYLRQVAAAWVKQGKTKRVRLGKYQKSQQKKLSPA